MTPTSNHSLRCSDAVSVSSNVSTDGESPFWGALEACRDSLDRGDMKRAEHHLAEAMQAASPVDEHTWTRRRRLLEQFAGTHGLTLTELPDRSSPPKVTAVPEYISPEGSLGISLVTCCGNRTENLLRALPSWLAHDTVSEIVIVDWSSTVPVREALGIHGFDDPRLRVIRVEDEPRWVLSYAFNIGFRFSRFDRILKADADIVLDPEFFNMNPLQPGTFVAGNWRNAAEGQAYVNGFFYLWRSDLSDVGGFNEYITTYGWDDDDIYDRLVLNGTQRADVAAETVLHLPHEDAKRSDDISELKAAGTIREELCAGTRFLIRRNRALAALSPAWKGNSRPLPFDLLSSRGADAQVRRSGWEPAAISEDIVLDANAHACRELLAWRCGTEVWQLGHGAVEMLLDKAPNRVQRIDIAIAASNCPTAAAADRYLVLDLAETFQSTLPADFAVRVRSVSERADAQGYRLVLRGDPAAIVTALGPDAEAHPTLGFWQKIGSFARTTPERLYALDRKAARNLVLTLDEATYAQLPSKASVAPAISPHRDRLFIDAQHGLGNRMRAIGSAAAIAKATGRELVIVWHPDHHCEGRLTDLFAYDGAVIEEAFPEEAARQGCRVYNYMEIETAAEKDAPIEAGAPGDIYARAAYVLNSPHSTWSEENRFLQALKPVREVQDLVASVRTPNDVAAHVRMVGAPGTDTASYDRAENWTEEGHAAINHWREKSHFSHFMDRIDALTEGSGAKRIFVAADAPETYDAFAAHYGDRVKWLPRAVYDRSAEQLRYALADALLLGSSPRLLGSSWSSFSELAMRLSPRKMTLELSGKDF